MADSFFVGLDLGRAQDFSALAVLERSWERLRSGRLLSRLALRHLQRWPLGTPYTTIAEETAALCKRPPLCNPVLAVDETGVGAAVLDIFRAAPLSAQLTPVLITAGHQFTREGAGWHVPKKELAGSLQVLLQSGRLKLGDIAGRADLHRELLAFRAKITPEGAQTFDNDWRTAPHDDLVLAVAIPCWIASRHAPPPPPASVAGGPMLAPTPAGWGCPGKPRDPRYRRMEGGW